MVELLLQLKLLAAVGDPCDPRSGGFFGLPTWYKYLEGARESGGLCAVRLSGLNDIWLIALAITEVLLRVAMLAAIAFVLFGGYKYIVSEGNPEKTAKAKNTVQDGLIGVLIAVIATAVVSFIAGRFQG